MKQPNKGVPFDAFAVDALRKSDDGDEPYVLTAEGKRVIVAAARALLVSRESNAAKREKFERVYALAHVLETKQSSPTAGRALSRLLSDIPAVAEILGVETKALRERGKRLARFLGADVIRRAPKVDVAAPIGSMKLSSMLVTRTNRQYR